MQVKDSE